MNDKNSIETLLVEAKKRKAMHDISIAITHKKDTVMAHWSQYRSLFDEPDPELRGSAIHVGRHAIHEGLAEEACQIYCTIDDDFCKKQTTEWLRDNADENPSFAIRLLEELQAQNFTELPIHSEEEQPSIDDFPDQSYLFTAPPEEPAKKVVDIESILAKQQSTDARVDWIFNAFDEYEIDPKKVKWASKLLLQREHYIERAKAVVLNKKAGNLLGDLTERVVEYARVQNGELGKARVWNYLGNPVEARLAFEAAVDEQKNRADNNRRMGIWGATMLGAVGIFASLMVNAHLTKTYETIPMDEKRLIPQNSCIRYAGDDKREGFQMRRDCVAGGMYFEVQGNNGAIVIRRQSIHNMQARFSRSEISLEEKTHDGWAPYSPPCESESPGTACADATSEWHEQLRQANDELCSGNREEGLKLLNSATAQHDAALEACVKGEQQ